MKQILLMGIGLGAAACSDPPQAELELGRRGFEIIGGLPATSAELDHTGALLYRVRSSGATGLLCSATLIGPEAVVTAQHCVAPLVAFERVGIDVSFARGPDFMHPEEMVPIAGFARSALTQGGAFGYGTDVAVIHLDHPVSATPAVVKPFSADLLGRSMVTLGYGISSAAGSTDGLRRIGRETVAAVEGRIYEALLGDFESFVEWSLTGVTSARDVLALLETQQGVVDLDALRVKYERWTLLDQHEAVTGTSLGDTQSCTGDSGGPLALVNTEGQFETYAVVSGGLNSARSACDYGQVFATFGPNVFPFVEAQRSWSDPCGDVDARGVCDAGVLRRCETSFANAVRRLTEQDCGAPGCLATEAGAECATPPEL